MKTDNIDSSFLEVLLELKRAIMSQLNVASLGLVRKVNSDSILVSLFPINTDEEDKPIECQSPSFTPNVGDIVLILFLDKNFITNLRRMQRHDNTILKVNDIKFHTKDYGIAILNLGGSNIWFTTT